ncbi:MAG: hypothetical protein U5L04_00435 [Trueperaceae bacterium]|nr:hypothetical protein [Trueperaceae bacterium]
MFRKVFLASALVALVSFAAAQTLAPTTGSGADDFDIGVNEAAVNQTVRLVVPEATALHLDVTDLEFDLNEIDGTGTTGDMVCVYGTALTDQTTQLGGNFYNQVQTLPLGTSYSPDGWPNVSINGGDVVTSYPPIEIGSDGELGRRTSSYTGRSFQEVLERHRVGPFGRTHRPCRWRTDPRSVAAPTIQDNPCDTFGAGTGLYELKDSAIRLVPENLNSGPTGSRTVGSGVPESCRYKSWLDDLVVVAVKVNSDYAGDNEAQLTYTLTTTSWLR